MNVRVDALDRLVHEAQPVVLRVLRRRFHGVSLAATDDRRENERARDCFQRAMLDLIAKFTRVIDNVDPPIVDLQGYAARVAHNVATDEIRPPNWSRLSNRLRRVLSAHAAFATWENPELGRVAGFVGWRSGRPSGSVAALRESFGQLRSGAVLATEWDRLGLDDWTDVLEHIFDVADGPLPMGPLVGFLAELFDIAVDVPPSSEGDDGRGEPEPPDPGPTPHEQMVLRGELAQLWSCIRGLRRDWRVAYLLNPPCVGGAGQPGARASGRGTARGEIEVLVAHAVASRADIIDALELSAGDHARLCEALAESDVSAALWEHLPLSDRLVGDVLGKTGMQVIALRKLAVRQLAGCMTGLRG